MEGADAVGPGDFSRRIAVAGDTEFDRVALAFNQMTDRVAERQSDLAASRDELERALTRRTEELNGLLASLRLSEANRKRLIADVSHELGTPLTIIRGEADVTLRGRDLPLEDYREALRRTRDAAAHTARIVEDLLLVARHEADEVRLRLERVDLVEIAAVVVEAAPALGAKPDRVVLASSLPHALVDADPLRLKQSLTILIESALRYGGERIEIRVANAPGGFRMDVVDDGPGMTPEDLERAFERFFRGGAAATRSSDGAGLGLPVARTLVEAHGGQILLANGPERGLAATIVLPDRSAPVPACTAASI